MIKSSIFIICLIFSGFISAADFYLLTDSTEINEDSVFVVSMNLVDARLISEIDLSAIEENFKILGRAEYSSYSSVNGKRESTTGYKLTMVPKKSGEIIIPSISVNTNEGVLTSLPIKFTVAKRDTNTISSKTISSQNPVIIEATPFVRSGLFTGESFVLKYKVKSLNSVESPNMYLDEIEDATSTQLDISKEYRVSKNGKIIKITEYYFLVTPLKPGKLLLPSLNFQGHLILNQGVHSFFGGSILGEQRPVFAKSKPITLNVTELPDKPNPWLGAKNLIITAQVQDNIQPKYAEPFTYKIEINAKGVLSKDLPDIAKLIKSDGFKIYNDSPKLTHKVLTNGDIISKREDIITIVPERYGNISIPELNISWYNLGTDTVETVKIDKLDFYIDNTKINTIKTIDNIVNEPEVIANTNIEAEDKLTRREKILIILVVFLGFTVFIVIGVFIWLIKAKLSNNVSVERKITKNKEKLEKFRKNLMGDNINPATILRQEILRYSYDKLKVPGSVEYGNLLQYLLDNNYKIDNKIVYVFEQVDSMIYSRDLGDCDKVRSIWDENKSGIKLLKNKKLTKRENLNPT